VNSGAEEAAPNRAAHLQVLTVEVEPQELPDMLWAAGRDGRRLWARPGMQLLGVGEALRIEMRPGWAKPQNASLVDQVLSSIGQHEGKAVAIGALPYDPDSPGHLVVPRLLVKAAGKRAWATLAATSDGNGHLGGGRVGAERVNLELARLREEQGAAPGKDPEPRPDKFRLSSTMPHADWLGLVDKALVAIENGEFEKVVLARRVEVVANRHIVLGEALSRLASLYPACAVFHVEGFIGASPETLLQREGAAIISHPLAGTVARSGDTVTDNDLISTLLSSEKERREHDLVVEAIASRLRPLCAGLQVPSSPSVVALRNVSHLGTVISGSLAEPGAGKRSPTALELAAVLHPTPAVGGHPVAEALKWQRDNEGFDRGCYAGLVGWVDSSGDGEWVLGLRSATVSGRRADLYAGAGIVAGSDPAAELAETQLKLQALLAALVRP
jgi:menaquinone-specific isochorismate synthase